MFIRFPAPDYDPALALALIDEAATYAGIRVTDVRAHVGRRWVRIGCALAPDPDDPARYRTEAGAICGHGHRAFFDALYRFGPETLQISTAHAHFGNRAHYLDTRHLTPAIGRCRCEAA